MHFFTDLTTLKSQVVTNHSFGPINSGTVSTPVFNKQFDISATFKVDVDGKVYACQNGMMIVQKNSSGSNWVNLIIKPDSGLDIIFQSVKYYVLRGVRKDSLIASGAIIPASATNKTDFISNFWVNQGSLPIPGVGALGFSEDPLLDPVMLEAIYNNNVADLSAVPVSEGEWIGNVKQDDMISFEIITNSDNLTLDVAYLRKQKHIVDVSSILALPSTPESDFSLKAAREQVLSYIDPAAFYGMHFDFTVTLGIAKTPKTGALIYTELLSKFATKNRIYIDVRSEKGYSYNYYSNYDDGSGNRMKIKPGGTSTYDETPGSIHDWPIYFTDVSIQTVSKAVFDIQLRNNDNKAPLLLIENGKLRGSQKSPIMLDHDFLFPGNTSTAAWSVDITLEVPNHFNGTAHENIASYLFLQYFREVNNSTVNTVFKNVQNWNSNFGAIDLPELPFATTFKHIKNQRRTYSKGGDFRYIAETGAYYDTNNVVLYGQLAFSSKESTNVYPRVDFSKTPRPNTLTNSVLPEDMAFNKLGITDGGNPVDVLEIVAYNIDEQATKKENLYLLGLTKVQLTTLQTISGLSDLHQRYVHFESVITTPVQKFRLKVYGLNDQGIPTIVSPLTDIFVYGTGSPLLTSPEFAASSTLPHTLRDPGNISDFQDVGTWQYDNTSAEVLAIDTADPDNDGFIFVQDFDDVGITRSSELKGQVLFPADSSGNINTSQASFPLIVILHGNGHNYTDYYRLSHYLASNGFIVASISCLVAGGRKRYRLHPFADPNWPYLFGGSDAALYALDSAGTGVGVISNNTIIPLSNWQLGVDFIIKPSTGTPKRIIFTKKTGVHGMASLGRANLLYPHLKIIRQKFTTHVDNTIGIIGHSRGGEGVVRAAKDITPALAHADLHSIKAVMSLAPTDLWQLESLTQNIPYFMLYGSKDGDVAGWKNHLRANGTGLDVAGSGGFSLWDRAQNNTQKSSVFVYGATHNGFITDNHDYHDISVTLETPEIQRAVCEAYTNAFFRRHLRNEIEWDLLFQGDYKPVSIGTPKLYQQFQNMDPSSKIVDDFTGSTTWVRNYSGTTGVLENIDQFSPHQSKGLIVDLTVQKNIEYSLPSANVLDVSGLSYFSFRITKIPVLPLSTYPDLSGLVIYIEDSLGIHEEITVPKEIPDPDPRKNALVGSWTDEVALTKSALITIHIPLTDYTTSGVDLTKIKKIHFKFPSTSSGKIALASIEFTN